MDDGYCEVSGSTVRACFHDRCWAVGQQQCGPFAAAGSTSTIAAWMTVTCEIADHVVPADSDWQSFQTFGPSGITAITGANSLASSGWTVDGINGKLRPLLSSHSFGQNTFLVTLPPVPQTGPPATARRLGQFTAVTAGATRTDWA